MASSLTCALSGELLNQVTDEIVVTPSGRLCRKSLLLTKLAENGGTDPFEKERPLSSDDLITVDVGKVMPPRASSTSLAALLGTLQAEYDALVLELFDTRKTLEETRRELSQALYQNDASIRVVARLAIERDAATQKLQEWNADAAAAPSNSTAVAETAEEPSAKRRRVEDKEKGQADGSIPEAHLNAMVSTWQTLSKDRKQTLKSTPVISKEDLNKYEEVDSKSWHKTRSKAGILASASFDNYVATAGRDKQLCLYDTNEKVLVHTIAKLPAFVSCLDVEKEAIVSGGVDGWVRLYKDGAYVDGLDLRDGNKKEAVVHVQFHPTGKHLLAATKSGRVSLCSLEQDKLAVVASFASEDNDTEYTCGALHPDGLIYGAGTSQGKVHIWDLRSQQLASTLEQEDLTDPLSGVVFSNNGYHIATSNGKVAVVWDLRKLKVLATLGQEEEGDASIVAMRFDAAGKHLAYGGARGVRVTTVKEWGVTAKLEPDHDVSNILWTNGGVLILSSDKERPIRFYGTKGGDVNIEE